MPSSSSDDDGGSSSCASPAVGGTQHTALDDVLDLDGALRRQRESSRRKRMERIEERRRERRREMERKRRRLRDDEGDDEGSSSAGSADLLAEASPLPSRSRRAPSSPLSSSPSPPDSPPRRTTSRISNRGSRRPSEKDRDPNNGGPLTSASAKVNSEAAANRFSDASPSSILKCKKGGSPSPSRVAFSGLAAPKRRGKNNGGTGSKATSAAQRKKWAPRYDSDSDDDERCSGSNNAKSAPPPAHGKKAWAPKYDSGSDDEKNNANNETISPAPGPKSWAPKYDSDSDGRKGHGKKNSAGDAAGSPAKRKKAWAPKYDSGSNDGVNNACNAAGPPDSSRRQKTWASKFDSDSDDGKGRSNNNDISTAANSPCQRKRWASKFDSDSDGDGKHKVRTNDAATRPPAILLAPTTNPWGDDSDSDDDVIPNARQNPSQRHATKDINGNGATITNRAATTRMFGGDSESSSDDDLEAMKRRLQEKNEREKAVAAAAARYSTVPTRSNHDASPSKRTQGESQRAPAVRKRSRLAQLTQDSDDSDESFAGAMMRELQAKKEAEEARMRAEKESSYRHNPLAMERREREELEERRARDNLDALVVNGKGVAARTPARRTSAGAGGLEGTEIVLGEDSAIKSGVSEMGDEGASRRARGSATPLEECAPRRPSRGTYKRRSGNGTDQEDSPNKKQRNSNPSFQGRGKLQDSEDDGLWDDLEDVKTKGDDDDSDEDDAKRKRGRGRQRGSRGSTQTRKRSLSKAKVASKAADSSSDDDSDAPTQKKKPAPRKKKAPVDSTDGVVEPRKPRASVGSGGSGSRWSSRYGADEEEDRPVSDGEAERLEGRLKPDFAEPKLGPPSPLVPFVLSTTWRLGNPLTNQTEKGKDGDDHGDAKKGECEHVDKVPASINRYLQEYQRAGIQFMYSSVNHGKGCVLGDDMGLGKTVQLISLIAALLKKTGTGLDELEIRRHRGRVAKVMRFREESKHQALLTGFGLKDEPTLNTIELPKVAPILIIVPPSVVKNWENEFETWGHFNVGVYSGQSREKALDRIKDGRDFILIVGKSIFVRAADYDRIADVQWKLVIVDEFHEFKNGKSQGYMRLQDLRDNSECPMIGMTGTLMQNNHDELYYLIDLVRPGLLGDIKDFRDEISRPVMYARAKDAKEGVMRLADRQEQLLRSVIRDAYLERKKEHVLKDSLTQKNERVVFCELSEVQKRIYRHILTLPDFELLRFANAPCECGVNKSFFRGYKKMRTHKEQLNYQRRHKNQLVPKKKCCFRYPFNPRRNEPGEPQIDPEAILWIQAHEKPIGNPDDIEEDVLDDKYIACQNCPTCITFAAMNKLYKISSHPALLQVDPCESGLDAKKKLRFAQVALTPDVLCELPGGTIYKGDGIMDDHIRLSGKMKTLDYLLRKYFRRRNRVLVFSYSTAALDVIQNHIKGQGWTNLRLDGQTPTTQRQALVDKFQTDDSIQIFLISTRAGGLGLNLTAANKVIIFDVNWNPSYDEQAQDRAYRIGQKRDVETVRLVARGTIEELIYARQVYKVQLKKQTLGHSTDGKNQPQIFRGVAKDKNRKGELFGLENLLKFKDGSFMSLLWKSSDNPQDGHDLSALAKELENMDEDQLDDLAKKGDEGPEDTRKMSYQNVNDEDGSDIGGINHQDLFSDTKGGAQIAKGDANFNEEMGGETQMIEVTAKLACEGMGDDGDDGDGDEEYIEDPEYEPHTGATPSPVKSSALNSSAKDGGQGVVRFPSPVKSSATEGGRDNTRDGKTASEDSCCQSPIRSLEKSTEKLSPDRSTADQSSSSFGELRTQPTTQQQSPKQMAPRPRKIPITKFSLMGTVFENSKNKKDPPTKKKSVGLYIPKYRK